MGDHGADASVLGPSASADSNTARSSGPASVRRERDRSGCRRSVPLVEGPSKYHRREILNGILYQLRTGCSWRSLPRDLPPWKIVHHYYRIWREDGSWEPVLEALVGVDVAPHANGAREGPPRVASAARADL